MKNCLLNDAGSFLLLVYEKSISVIELPSKWGRFEQFNGGNLNIICKYTISLYFKIKKTIKTFKLLVNKLKSWYF